MTYLGDIISGNGSNKKNVTSRIEKGHGKINDILNILEKTSLGYHYFRIALLLRESRFLNSILTNAYIWYGRSKSEIEQFEQLDLVLLRKFLKTPFSVPAEAVYLELGCLNIETIIKARRIVYLQYLVKQEESSMLNNFFMAQWKYPAKRNEWTEQVQCDLNDFGLSVDLDILRKISINSFKTQVKKKAKQYAFYTFLEKKESHSKIENLFFTELKLQNYLNLENMNKIEAQTIFSYRTRMSNFGENYHGAIYLPPLQKSP